MQGKVRHVELRVPVEEHERLVSRARAAGDTVAGYVRRALIDGGGPADGASLAAEMRDLRAALAHELRALVVAHAYTAAWIVEAVTKTKADSEAKARLVTSILRIWGEERSREADAG